MPFIRPVLIKCLLFCSDIILSATECFSDKLAALIHLEGVADGCFNFVGMEQAECVFADFVVVGGGEPAFEGVVVERDPADEDLDSQVDGVGQVLDDGFDFPEFAVFIILDYPEVPIDGILHPEGVQARSIQNRPIGIETG